MRLRNDPKAKQILNDNLNIFVNEPTQHKSKWNSLFNNNHPIYLEVGSGKGKFILENAIKFPNINFIALEKNTVICSKIIKNYLKLNKNLNNLKVINIDAKKLLDIFNNDEIDKIYLNFSDPWPKKRHYKNRLTHDNFLKLFHLILKKGNLIELKTDNDNFYNWSLENINNNNQWEVMYYTNNLYNELSLDCNINNIATEYENRFVNLNKNINKIIFKNI